MSGLDWDHNAYYHRLLLRQLPRPCERVLDVGCGAGTFATTLAGRAAHVDALDRAPEMIELARRAVPANVRCVLGDVLHEPLPDAEYDAIVSVTALHHMRLEQALPRLAAALRPGGVLAAVALPRPDLPRELPVELAGALGHRILGLAFAWQRAAGRGDWFARERSHATMPAVLDPPLTTRQAAKLAAELLPGARVRRLVFWRYLLVWRKPRRADGQRGRQPVSSTDESGSGEQDGQEQSSRPPTLSVRYLLARAAKATRLVSWYIECWRAKAS